MLASILIVGLSLCSSYGLATPDNKAQPSSTLPTVDLGYEVHQALSYNVTGAFYNFSNIRYAAPPTGNLRWSPPVAPATNRSPVNGSVGRICPQANAQWLITAAQFIPSYLTGQSFDASRANQSDLSSLPYDTTDPRITEDCLFLDVVVPAQVFNASRRTAGAPVFVWIHGGGYIGGSKGDGYNPSGLFAAAAQAGSKPFVFVSINYRLGAFGFLSGPTLQEGGSANAGLLDQRFALEWVQKYIYLFGGDKNKVTVGGESAGAGSLTHQVTAYGDLLGPPPFQQALIQSPGWLPYAPGLQLEQIFNEYLNRSKVSSLQQLRQQPTEVLLAANRDQVFNSPYGQFSFGPVVDGNFTPAHPIQILSRGQVDPNITLLVAHNSNEGLLFTNPLSQNSSAFSTIVRNFVPAIQPKEVDYVSTTLYPSNGGTSFVAAVARAATFLADGIFNCNAKKLSLAFNSTSYAYQFAVPPGLHGQDTRYTFWDGGVNPAVTNSTVARVMQQAITSFISSGRPTSSASGIGAFPLYGTSEKMVNLGATGITVAKDNTGDLQCSWWKKALWD